jgi:hypothetical protein
VIRAALRSLTRDGWAIGIAAAAALAYAIVTFVENLVGFALALIDGYPVIPATADDAFAGFYDPPYTFVLAGHYVPYEGLARATLMLALVVIVAAIALYATRNDEATDSSSAARRA